MLLPAIEYARPNSLAEALELLAERPDARPLAGGQTLVNVMKTRMAAPDVVVDLGRISELRGIRRTEDGGLAIGAMTTYAELIASPEVREARPILAEVAETIADVQVRNRGTVGGNLCANDPTNHLPPLAVAVGASMTIAWANGTRDIPADEFFLGVYQTAVGPGELLVSITVPPADGAGDGWASLTLGRDGTGIVNVAATLRGSSQIKEARIAIGCVAAVPERARAMEARLKGAPANEARVREAAEGLGAALDPPSDVHASADYRRHLAEVLAVRATLQAAARARGD